MENNKLVLFFLTSSCIIIPSCNNKIKKEMMVSTGNVTEVTITTAKISGQILDLGEGATACGHCYATTANPTISGTKTELNNPIVGKYISNLTALSASTKYYVRAYLSRGSDVVYGSDTSFTTLSDAPPVLTTSDVTDISTTTAISGGNITSEGGTPVTMRGVCWSTTTNPTVALSTKTTDGPGTGSFTSSITGLTEGGTKYYVRAYATNSGSTGYGNEISFTTNSPGQIPSVTTNPVTSVTSNSAISGGEVIRGVSVDSRGVCWNTSANPKVDNNKTTNGSGLGKFVSNLSGLSPATQYYVRAYAHNNDAGYSYADAAYEYSFITCRTPVEATNAVSNITNTTVTLNAHVNANSVNDSITKVFFEYGSTISYGNTKAAAPATLTGNTLTAVSAGLTGLTVNADYHCRVIAVNCGGTTYGSDIAYTTLASLTTASISGITATSASCGGNIPVDGGASINERGVCWNTSSNPTIANSKIQSSSGTGSFISNLTGLTSNTKYYVRAYAKNNGGTAYGDQQVFTTLPIVSTTAISNITLSTASTGGTIDHGGGENITAKGVCWDTSPNPTISLTTKTNDGSGIDSFTSSIAGLSPDMTYYVRAYATNTSGTSYGASISFNTQVTDIDGNIYDVVHIGAQKWMKENLKTTKYNDGTAIGPLYVGFYDKDLYGGVYRIDVLDNVCPTGWHVSTDADWTTLTDYLGGEIGAGGKLKETGTTHWGNPNTGATNESGFSAVPGGARTLMGGFFNHGSNGYWWSPKTGVSMYFRQMNYNNADVNTNNNDNALKSIRCLRDN